MNSRIVIDLSAKESFFMAQYIPRGMEIRQIKNNDKTLSKIVAGIPTPSLKSYALVFIVS